MVFELLAERSRRDRPHVPTMCLDRCDGSDLEESLYSVYHAYTEKRSNYEKTKNPVLYTVPTEVSWTTNYQQTKRRCVFGSYNEGGEWEVHLAFITPVMKNKQ